MRLKKIKLAGFKSFVDPTVIPIVGNMTGIVGPNGCGKSNSIDCVRWVMGESSARYLRGESATDMIFNGSASRKPVGQASVELVFDNTDKRIEGEYAAYNEIAIKRTVTRDGQSKYHLNNTSCRRKDITDLFLGTGLGPRSYSIIEQGTISRLIEAKPEDLRLFLEEAAGISKYKERRRETENRIKHTRENLERLTDIRDELGKQIERLDRQAKAAIKYKEYRAEEQLLKAQLLTLRWQVLNNQLTHQEQLIKEQDVQLEAFIAEQRHLELEITHLKQAQIEKTDAFNTIQSRYYGLGNEIARLEEAIAHQRDKKQQLQADLVQVEQSIVSTQHHIQTDESTIAELHALITQLEPERATLQTTLVTETAALQAVEAQRLSWQQAWDDFNRVAAESSKAAHVEQARLAELEKRMERLSDRIAQLQTQQSLQSVTPLIDEIEQLQTEQVAVLEVLGAEQDALSDILKTIQTVRAEIQQTTLTIADLRQGLQQDKGRYASLEALQQAALGKHDTVMNQWLGQHGLENATRLGESLQVTPEWQLAVETILGDDLQAVCTDDLAQFTSSLESLEEGHLTLFSNRELASLPVTAGATLASQVTTPISAISALLSDIFIADSAAEAQAMSARLAPHQSVICRSGLWFGAGWVRVLKKDDANRGVLQRAEALQSLDALIEKQVESLAVEEARLENLQSELTQQESLREGQQQRINDLNKQKAMLAADLQLKEGQLQQLQRRAREIETELVSERAQSEACSEEITAAREAWQIAMLAMDEQATHRDAQIAERDAIQTQWTELRESLQLAREAVHEIDLRYQSSQAQLQSAHANAARMQEQLSNLVTRREGIVLALMKEDAPDINIDAQLQEKLVQHQQVEQALKEARQACELVESTLRTKDDARSSADQQARAVQSRLGQLRIDRENSLVRVTTIEEQMREGDFDPVQVAQSLPPELTESACDQRLQQLSQQITRLGPINLAAIDEYKVESERKAYLDAQNEDLTEALETLENAIRKIDRETRTRFKETYDKVDSKFQELFPRLFGGGKAYLELTGEDLLDTGVSVMARPPGKRNSSIHLLSGGEKAMTAVALVFSIFHLNPSPFCMLDEVDAPLDDANVSRFCQIVKEMSSQTQFIFITHNKVTMEAATHLVGVTMHEPGVSRIVAVDIEQAVDLATA